MKRANKILLIMVTCSIVALGFGYFVLQNRSSNPVPKAANAENDQTQNAANPLPQTPTPEPESTTTSTADWKTYTNDKHGFSVLYPPNLKGGSISDNSILGTYDVPVKGYHIGPLVFVVLKDADLKKQAEELFNNVYNAAKNPTPAAGAEIPPIECKVDLDTADKKSVSCNGEGGPAKYGYIIGPSYDVLVDGYTRGYDSQDNGTLSDNKDYIAILESFSFK